MVVKSSWLNPRLFQVIHIFCVPTSQMMSYPVRDPSMTLREITTLVERETQIAVARQDLLLSSGLEPHQGKPAQQCIVGDQVSSEQCIVGVQVHVLGVIFTSSCMFIDNKVGRWTLNVNQHYLKHILSLFTTTRQIRCCKITFRLKY